MLFRSRVTIEIPRLLKMVRLEPKREEGSLSIESTVTGGGASIILLLIPRRDVFSSRTISHVDRRDIVPLLKYFRSKGYHSVAVYSGRERCIGAARI